MKNMSIAFNQISEKPRFIYKANPASEKAFQIFEWSKRVNDDYQPVGDYIVLDSDENRTLSEKKLINLISMMNGKGIAVDLTKEVEEKTLYHVKNKKVDTEETQVIFRTHDGKGVSVENAILKVKGGIFNG